MKINKGTHIKLDKTTIMLVINVALFIFLLFTIYMMSTSPEKRALEICIEKHNECAHKYNNQCILLSTSKEGKDFVDTKWLDELNITTDE